MFDLDGTLAATGRDLANSVNYTRGLLGLAPLDDAVVFRFVGHGTEHLIRRSLPAGYENRFDEALALFLEHYEKHLLDTTALYPNVEETLDRFGNKKRAVVTNKREYLAVGVLRGLGIEKYFDAIVGGDSGLNKKPDPGAVNHVLAELNVEARKALMIGDGETDIAAGKAAGVYTCGVTYGLGDKEDIVAARPDILIDDLGELANYID